MEDEKIIELYESRDQTAIAESDTKYGKALRGISFKILSSKEDSDECVNDSLLKAWNSIPPQKPKSLFAYLGRIVRNASIDRWHSNRTKKHGGDYIITELSDCIPSGDSVENAADESELMKIITSWLKALMYDDRVLFMKRYWFGETLESIAKENNVTPNKLAGHMFRLRQKLKATLENEGIIV